MPPLAEQTTAQVKAACGFLSLYRFFPKVGKPPDTARTEVPRPVDFLRLAKTHG